MKAIDIAAEFSKTPGPRYRSEGQHSGQQFREELLEPRFLQAQKAGEKLVIDFEGAEFGYPVSFLEEAFGGLAREHGIDAVKSVLSLENVTEALLKRRIERYINDANKLRPSNASPTTSGS